MACAAAFLAGAALAVVAAWLYARRELARRDRRYGRLLSFANHELNTPATAVNMTIINLLSGVFGEIPADQQKWLELTRDQVGRLNALVGELRDLTHMELLRDLKPILSPAAPSEVVEDALTGLRRGFEHSGVELLVEIPEGLPRVTADADRLARTLSSLLFHARKFRLSGPVKLRVAADGPVVAFEIDYAGQPLSPDDAAASLDLWYPARERKDQLLSTTGMGLGFARRLARLCGGDLDFTVDEKGRTRLRLTAPVYGGQ